jgi:hypothetical protein
MSKNNKSILIAFVPIVAMCWAGCEVIEQEGVQVGSAAQALDNAGFDSGQYSLTSDKAKSLVGSDKISQRGRNFELNGIKKLPKVKFKKREDNEVKAQLTRTNKKMLGVDVDESEMVDNGSVFSAATEDAFTMCAKDTGACTSKIHSYPRGISKIADAEEAVNLALEQVADKDLLELGENETLDVVSVGITMNAAWFDNNGTTEPVYFETGKGQEPVTEFASDYTVSFGRRYKGVPIIGPTLVVRLEAQGRMAAFMKNWRDIEEEDGEQVDLLSENEKEKKKKEGLEEDLELEHTVCGYMEAPGDSYHQDAAGIGCEYIFNDPDAEDMMVSKKIKKMSIAKDPSLSIEGTYLQFNTGPGDEEPSEDSSEDIPE